MRWPKPVRWRSKRYRDFVAGFECIGCPEQDTYSDPHHCVHPDVFKDAHGKGMSQKHSDQWLVPVCRDCHDHYHDTRCFPGLSVEETNTRIAIKQLELMASWIELEDCF